MKVLYSGFDLCDPSDLGVDDDQRPGADDPRDVHEHRDRPAARQVRAPTTAASRPTTKPQKIRAWTLATVRGTVQADILKEDQGQNTCIFSTEFSAEGDGRHPAVLRPPQRAQLLLGVDLRLSHRRGRREPDLAARVHARRTASPSSRPTSRAACTSTTSRRTCRSSSPTAWTPSTRCIGRVARRIWAVAMRDALRRQRAQPEAQVPRPDVAAARCTRRRSRSTTSAPRCRR